MKSLVYLILFISGSVYGQTEFRKLVGKWEGIEGSDTLTFLFEQDSIITIMRKNTVPVVGGRESILKGKKIRMIYSVNNSHRPFEVDFIIQDSKTKAEQQRIRGIFNFISYNEIIIRMSRGPDRPKSFSDETIRMIRQEPREIPGEYPEVSVELLSAKYLEYLDEDQLQIMRNEIFARYGYIFKKEELKEYFGEQKWYKPRFTDVTSKLTDIEKSNIKLIVAREAWLRAVELKKLPLISLPRNLNDGFKTDFNRVTGIAPQAEKEAPFAYVGLLPDTSRYYAVLWYIKRTDYSSDQAPRIYYVTTYTRNLTEIASTQISLPVGGSFELSTDCKKENLIRASFIQPNLSYTSTCSFYETCPGESKQSRTFEISGQIIADGTFNVLKSSGY